MDHENTQNIYDDGNIPDSDLPERSGNGQSGFHYGGQNRLGQTPNGSYNHGENHYPYSPEDYDGIDPELGHEEPDLVWVTPPVLLSETAGPNAAPGIV